MGAPRLRGRSPWDTSTAPVLLRRSTHLRDGGLDSPRPKGASQSFRRWGARAEEDTSLAPGNMGIPLCRSGVIGLSGRHQRGPRTQESTERNPSAVLHHQRASEAGPYLQV
ncbi:hypothetical protein NDU88_005649 [Pleurodeles waltl]|uniref:Uncharacterized protein n=1 Tax=Pleurodeles waltl TaxID=8319 RepID=A0AAV7MYP3_PLEWA|nr:hypothetical protein NDU88_005649 [Pleurodeles waltl]